MVDYVSILAASVISFVIGMLWYSPVFFGKRWIALSGVDMKKAKKLGLEEGPSIGKLQSGHSIEHNGKKIMPDDVSYTEKGKVVAYVTDTLLCEGCYKTAKDADILICEATYS